MRAVEFDVSVPGFLLARTLGRMTDAARFGRLSALGWKERPSPPIPGDRWVELEVVACGICGTDVANLSFASSTAMEPFGSFPAVPGHEILARVASVGPAVERLEPGRRVVVDPMLSCSVRGHADRCRSCTAGRPATCERAGEPGAVEMEGEPLAPGLTIGYHRDLPGGWCEAIVAHEEQVHPVPGELDDRTAVLVEPLSIGMHAALGTRPWPDGPVLVIGSGPIALGTIWALRAAGFGGRVVGQTKRPHEARTARSLGASEVVSPGPEAREALIRTGAKAYRPIRGPEVYAGGGFPLIFDCVGSEGSLDQALRFAAPGGRVVLLGCAGELRKLDLTFTWARELEIVGALGYGRERWRGETRHTFEVTLERLVEDRRPVAEMVTHVFPLEQYRDGLSAAADHARSGAIKVLLEPGRD